MDACISHTVTSMQYPISPTSTRHRESVGCCCGKTECAYLQHNNRALAGLEKDVETAAQLGQALLERHEWYMADAEADRSKMVAEIERLEKDKEKVQAENVRIIEENRGLLEQLEDLNEAIADSDAHVKSLTATLESTQLEIRRLTISASRVAQLEAQIRDMESEQSQLHEKLIVSQEDGRSAVQRWRKAECALRDLHDQVDRIEKEAREERERHVELLGRMERKRAVERELDSAAGRLKGAAAVSSLGRSTQGTGVVSHFVRDILQDNANLQLGIVELREMLQNSNEEVQNLREQILLHQPLPDAEETKEQNRVPLSEELDAKLSGSASQEFHVHHHYHVPPARQQRETSQIPTFRRQKKRRAMIPFSILESPSRNPPRRPPVSHYARGSTSSTSTILSQTSVSIPPSGDTYRWSNQSSASAAPGSVISSLPGSPQSVYRASSIFDRVESGFDSSRPTSPESTGFSSPVIVPAHRRGPSDVSFRSISGPAFHEIHNKPSTLHNSREQESGADSSIERNGTSVDPENCTNDDVIPHPSQVPIPEEAEESPNFEVAGEREQGVYHPAEEDEEPSPIEYRRVRRSTSHESLLSVSGMDIHTLRERPSQLSFSNFAARTPSRMLSTNSAYSSSPPVISRTNAIVPSASLSSSPSNTSTALLSSVAAAMNPANDTASVISSSSSGNRPTSPSPSQIGNSLSKRMGGWVLGKWGVTPIPSSGERENASNCPTPEGPSAKPSQSSPAASQIFLSRSPGVNQRGPIPGFRPVKRIPVTLHPDSIDERLLQESLRE